MKITPFQQYLILGVAVFSGISFLYYQFLLKPINLEIGNLRSTLEQKQKDLEEAKIKFSALSVAIDTGKKLEIKYGRNHEDTNLAFEELSKRLSTFKLAPKMIDKLIAKMRNMLHLVRDLERVIVDLSLNKAKLSKNIFLKSFVGQEINLEWVDDFVNKNIKFVIMKTEFVLR